MSERLTVYTCPAPSHVLGAEYQGKCAASWAKYRHVQLASIEEGGTLKRSAKGLYGKPYVFIDDIFAHFLAYDADRCIITNSDIELRDEADHLDQYLQHDGIVIANRQDHNGDYQGQTYLHGFDLFILTRQFVQSLPPSLFCIGQTWWDYWLPYRAIKQGIAVRTIKEPILWHHRHEQQHNGAQWARMTEHFCWLEGYSKIKSPSNVTSEVYHLIRKHAR